MTTLEQRVLGTAALLVLSFWVMAGLNLCGLTALHWLIVTSPLWVPASLWGLMVLSSVILYFFGSEETD